MRFLIDANLPYRCPIWQGDDFLHVVDIDDTLPDSAVWQLAKAQDRTIVTKDADFSDRIMLASPPPHVIHLRVGNMRLRELVQFIEIHWPRISELSERNKLVIVHSTLIECIA